MSAGNVVVHLPATADIAVKRWDSAVVRINKIHRQAQRYAENAVDCARTVGELLLAEKQRVGHGTWLQWLQMNVEFGERTARNYMRLAKELPKLDPEKRQRVADLSFRDALQALATDTNRLTKLPETRVTEAIELADERPLHGSVTRVTTAERVQEQQRAQAVPVAVNPLPAWRVALRDKVLALAQETVAEHPELELGDILDALNDAYCHWGSRR